MPAAFIKKENEGEVAARKLEDRERFPPMPPEGKKGHPTKLIARPAAPLPEGSPGGGGSLEELGIPGRSSLLWGPPSPEPLSIFRMLSGGRKALVMSGSHPARLRERFGLDEAQLVWLTAHGSSKEEALGPQALEYEMLGRAARHFRQHRGGILLLDDLDYLSSQCGFEPLARFLKSVSDAGAELRGTFLAAADPEAFSGRERAVLLSVFDAVRPVAGRERPAGPPDGPLLPPSTNCLVLGNGPAAYRILEAAARTRRALCITPHAPGKLKQRHDLWRAEFLWLSESASGEGVLRPQKFAYEGQRAAQRHLRTGAGALVFLDDLEKLRLYAEFPEVVRFVKGVCDAAADRGGSVVASLGAGMLEKSEEASLRKRFEMELG